MTEVVTYYSSNAKKHQAWIAYVVLPLDGNQLLVRSEGHTEDEAKQRAIAWYEKEKARQERLYRAELEENKPVDDDGWTSNPGGVGSGKGQVFVGKLWMLNRTTGQRARIEPSELQSYEAQGYVRGGPRSK